MDIGLCGDTSRLRKFFFTTGAATLWTMLTRRASYRSLVYLRRYSTRPIIADAIPSKPTWSVRELIDSMPEPKLEHETLQKLHDLSALHLPPRDSAEYKTLKKDMENLVRLVDAVRVADFENAGPVLDDSQLAKDEMLGHMVMFDHEQMLEEDDRKTQDEIPGGSGRELLSHAQDSRRHLYHVPLPNSARST
jgi:Asp-tRNA(Asn)/Glu-tRNA(Gln) amidotransferase C subunit